jgi:hypothetical protein
VTLDLHANLRLVGRDVVGAELSRSLVGSHVADPVSLNCELVRSVLWATTRQAPVHINRLLNVVVDLGLAFASDADEDTTRRHLRDTLDELAEFGDVIELDQGRWSATAPRIIDLGPASDEHLLLGGVPTSVLPDTVRAAISHREVLRFVRGPELARALALPIDPLDAWLATPSLPLRDWARALLATPLGPYTAAVDGSSLLLYAPQATKRRTQSGRWARPAPGMNGRYLGERTRFHGGVESRLVELHDGVTTASGNVLMPGERRRLMYAFDAFADRQVDATIHRDADQVRLVLWSEVPSAERRFLSLVGKVSAGIDHYYPRTWHFPRRWEPEVRRRLEALEIRLLDDVRERH